MRCVFQILCPNLWLACFLNSVFWRAEVLNVMKSNLSIVLWLMLLVDFVGNFCPIQGHKMVISFILIMLTFGSMIPPIFHI